MLDSKIRKFALILLFAGLTLPFGIAKAADTSTQQAASTASSGSPSGPTIVSGTDPEPASPNIIQVIFTILTAG